MNTDKPIFRCLLSGLLFLLGTTCTWASDYAPGEILVKYRNSDQVLESDRAMRASPVEYDHRYRWQRLRLPPELTVEQAVAHYRQQPEVEYAEPNYIASKAELSPNDIYYSSHQWGLQNLRSERAWDETTGSSDMLIAVVDTGIFYDHPDLKGNMWINPGETRNGEDDDGNGIIDDIHGVNYNSGTTTGDPKDDDIADWHGTHVAGIAGAVSNNDLGIAGVNWGVKVMAVKVLHGASGSGFTSDIVSGIDYAIANGANVINLSLTIPGYSNALADALARADAAGILTVSAAGNSGSNNDAIPYSPAGVRTDNNIAVAAINRSDDHASYSNYGRLTVDLAAPGGECTYKENLICVDPNAIYSTIGTGSSNYDNYRYLAGTSMATPHVSGLAALIWSHVPDLTHRQVKARILNGARKLGALDHITISGGTADAYAALTTADKPAVFRVAPSSAYAGDTMTITGANFGTSMGRVTVGELEFPVPSSWSDTTIKVNVPRELPTIYNRLQVGAEGSGFFVRRLNHSPTASFAVDPAGGTAPLTVTLTASASDVDGAIVSYEWDVGDGTFSHNTGASNVLQHTFTSSGTYPLRVRVSDSDGGTAIASTSLTVTSGSSDTDESDSRCFIATAAYGSPLADEVMVLRKFRDRYLIGNRFGEAFVEFYYTNSPALANAIRNNSWMRGTVRMLLRPAISLIGWFMNDATAGSSRPASIAPNESDQTSEHEYIVAFVAGTNENMARTIVKAFGGLLREYDSSSNYGVVVFTQELIDGDTITQLESHPEVRYVEPNLIGGKPPFP
ncbi:S8 family serine peptidase [Thiohalomonas denitrificans]|uniref:Serine protease, subtilisin family n=1 Tax=Thiohalomonas denitrificans TaxID=415747 RepID=A0A1G5QM18_9GAMM|nr:S8 family serine peptidase [Thiohalomonas denitrificans]SCZ62884.1 Serine protease, subtilisin family [Thiohalomonas denitrificans]